MVLCVLRADVARPSSRARRGTVTLRHEVTMPVRHVVGSHVAMTNAEYVVMLSALCSMMSVARAALACCSMHCCALCSSGACCLLAHCMADVTASDAADFDVHVDKLVAMGFRSREVAPCCSIVSCAAPCCKHLVPVGLHVACRANSSRRS